MPATKAETADIIAGERLRIMGILESAEGRSHPATARHFALTTNLTAEQANAALANLPVESPFLEAMDREGPVGVRPSTPGATGMPMPEDAKEARLAELKAGMTVFNRAKGYRA